VKLKLPIEGKLVQFLVDLKLLTEVKMDSSLVKLELLLEGRMFEALVNLNLKHAQEKKSPQVDSPMFLLQMVHEGLMPM
jgi:hypothetical protein